MICIVASRLSFPFILARVVAVRHSKAWQKASSFPPPPIKLGSDDNNAFRMRVEKPSPVLSATGRIYLDTKEKTASASEINISHIYISEWRFFVCGPAPTYLHDCMRYNFASIPTAVSTTPHSRTFSSPWVKWGNRRVMAKRANAAAVDSPGMKEWRLSIMISSYGEWSGCQWRGSGEKTIYDRRKVTYVR